MVTQSSSFDINITYGENSSASTNNWALSSENTLLENLFEEIEQDKHRESIRRVEAVKYITNILDNINVDFEPDPSYRENVKHIIIGLVLSQILKQKTINIYRKGKEDREYLGSYLMMKIQSYLFNNYEIHTWNDIIKDIYNYYRSKMRISADTEQLIQEGINQRIIIQNDILVSTVLSNKKSYKTRTGVSVPEYN